MLFQGSFLLLCLPRAAGKGRGLVLTQTVVPGDLLMVLPAMAFLEGELGEVPEPVRVCGVWVGVGAGVVMCEGGSLRT